MESDISFFILQNLTNCHLQCWFYLEIAFLFFQMNSIKLSLNLYQGNERLNFKEFFCDMIPLITF